MLEQPEARIDDQDGSVTVLLGALKSGDSAAAGPLWERYFARLVSFAKGRLRMAGGPGTVEDEEDAALSAIDSFLQGVRDERFPRLENRESLWQILAMVTKRKVIDQVERRNTAKRGGNHRQVDGGMDKLASPGLTPDATALLGDQCRLLLDALSREDPSDRRHLRMIALWKLEGFTNEEIAKQIGCALRTVANRLELIRKIWESEARKTA
jgi:DNA-directed RNA polymerase specialized sigma24 family protein